MDDELDLTFDEIPDAENISEGIVFDPEYADMSNVIESNMEYTDETENELYPDDPLAGMDCPEGVENSEINEIDVNYDEIYEPWDADRLREGYSNVDIDADTERLNGCLSSFEAETWENLSDDERKGAMNDLADYVIESIGFEEPPNIEYYNSPSEGDYGGYNETTNTLSINEYMLYNSDEAADTVAHELWHAHQYECSLNPQNERDFQYRYNFEPGNYISPDEDFTLYQDQLIEAEARAFAQEFKDRIGRK